MAFRTRNQAAEASYTATRPLARKAGRWVRWNRRMKAIFLDTLASTCCVRTAAAAIEVDPASVYALRRRDAEFVREWGIALEAGYQMLETAMVGHLLGGGGNREPVDLPHPIDFEAALRLLAFHGAAPGANGRAKGGPPRRRASDEDVDGAILRKLAAIEKRRKAA